MTESTQSKLLFQYISYTFCSLSFHKIKESQAVTMAPNEAPHYSMHCSKIITAQEILALHTLLYHRHRKSLTVMVIKRRVMKDRKQVLLISAFSKLQYMLATNIGVFKIGCSKF